MIKKLSFILFSAAVMMFAACNRLQSENGNPPADAFQITNFNTSFTLEPGERQSVNVMIRNAKGDVTVKTENDDNVKAVSITYDKTGSFSQGVLTFEATTLEAKTLDVVFIFNDGTSTFRKTLNFTITEMTPFTARFKDAKLHANFLESELSYNRYDLVMNHIHGDVTLKKITGIPDNLKVEFVYESNAEGKVGYINIVNTVRETSDKAYDAVLTFNDTAFDVDVPVKFVCAKHVPGIPTVEILPGGDTRYWPLGYKNAPVASFRFKVTCRSPLSEVTVSVKVDEESHWPEGSWMSRYEQPVVASDGKFGIDYSLDYSEETGIGEVKVWGRSDHSDYEINEFDYYIEGGGEDAMQFDSSFGIHPTASTEGGTASADYEMGMHVFEYTGATFHVGEGHYCTLKPNWKGLELHGCPFEVDGTQKGVMFTTFLSDYGEPVWEVEDYCKDYFWMTVEPTGRTDLFYGKSFEEFEFVGHFKPYDNATGKRGDERYATVVFKTKDGYFPRRMEFSQLGWKN